MSAATDGGELVADAVALAVGAANATVAAAEVAGRFVPTQPATARQVSVAQAEATNETTSASASAVRIALLNAMPRRSVRPIIRRIPRREITKFRDDLVWLLRHTVETLDGLTDDELNWRPPATDANSLLVLATHTLGAAEAHVLELLAGQEIDRVRSREFAATGDAGPVRARLSDVIERLTSVLDALDPAELDRERPTPGGSTTGREVLLWAVMHASQHHGVAQLTRDLILGARPPR
jgi:hypothetical protein